MNVIAGGIWRIVPFCVNDGHCVSRGVAQSIFVCVCVCLLNHVSVEAELGGFLGEFKGFAMVYGTLTDNIKTETKYTLQKTPTNYLLMIL